MNLDGSGMEIVARGVRNTVGFDFHPRTGELWFTDNQRDWLSEDLPHDELNRLTKPGQQHFGYPYCHQGDFADPEFGWGKACDDYVEAGRAPRRRTRRRSACASTRARCSPRKYQGAIFIARHGPWNRTKKYAADVVVAHLDKSGKVTKVEPFLTGLVENNAYLGRPVDVLVLKDGSLLVSDDHNGAVYRVSYGEVGSAVARRGAGGAPAAGARRARPRGRVVRGARGGVPGLSRAERAVADPRDPVDRRPAVVLRRRPALPVPARAARSNAAMTEVAKHAHRRRSARASATGSRSCRRPRRRPAPPDRRAPRPRARRSTRSARAPPATTPTSPGASRCRAWPTSARSTCSRRCASYQTRRPHRLRRRHGRRARRPRRRPISRTSPTSSPTCPGHDRACTLRLSGRPRRLSHGLRTVHDALAPARAEPLRRPPVGPPGAALGRRARLQRGLDRRAPHRAVGAAPGARPAGRPGAACRPSASASAPAGSCCPTTTRPSWPTAWRCSTTWRRGGSTSAWRPAGCRATGRCSTSTACRASTAR